MSTLCIWNGYEIDRVFLVKMKCEHKILSFLWKKFLVAIRPSPLSAFAKFWIRTISVCMWVRTKFQHSVSVASMKIAGMTTAPMTTTVRETEGSPAVEAATSTTAAAKHHMNLFDLANVGLSSTLAIAIFIGIGYVVRHVAGPSAIVSVLIAACIAYLVGKFSQNHKLHISTELSKWQAHHSTAQHTYLQPGLLYR